MVKKIKLTNTFIIGEIACDCGDNCVLVTQPILNSTLNAFLIQCDSCKAVLYEEASDSTPYKDEIFIVKDCKGIRKIVTPGIKDYLTTILKKAGYYEVKINS